MAPASAFAHVKWFAPYIVNAAPSPIARTLSDPFFWTGLALVLVFFLATRLVERSALGDTTLDVMDRISEPLWLRLDGFVRIVIAAFFVAIFAVGGVYLTPDLKTSAEWVSWLQLLIAAGIVSRRTMPLSAAGIIFLWVLALRDYQLFHLLDYLALGVAVAAYLVLEASNRPEWRKHRFEVLRWGVAIALMWSSLEKFAYPEWFYPLVIERPFLTFGMPRDMFIPMAGVAEFTMGFGLLATPLVRRLSAIALFVIFNAAVFPFGRIDLIGHALIMAIIVAIAADHNRELHFWSWIRRALVGVPVGLASALIIFATAYWGLHAAFYGANAQTMSELNAGQMDMATHSFSTEHPHGPLVPAGDGGQGGALSVTEAYEQSMMGMHEEMMEGLRNDDPDVAFVRGMIPHHQGAIDMARIQLEAGSDPVNMALARHIIADQQQEIDAMHAWLRERGLEDE
ncbi:membrane protein [Martelella endophytica]|uniref:Membrane protein n=1 Tax=Martelella endophytica TaxID=1486262 RepID=A0A0D5LVN2_MAREN|nr:membrane protein [Martelella endophytica]